MEISLIFFIAGVLCLFVNNRKINTFGIIFVLVGIAYIAAIRPDTSADTANYRKYYENSKLITEYSFSLGRTYYDWVENWYLNFCSVFAKNGVDFRIFLFVISLLINTVSVYSIYKLTSLYTNGRFGYLALILLYLSNYGFLYSYVVIRGGISFAFGLLGVYFFVSKKYFRSAINILISVAMHNYSLVIILLLLLLKLGPKRIHPKVCMTIFSVLLLMAFFRVDVLFTNYVVDNLMSFLSKFSAFSFSHYLQEASFADGIKKGTVLIILQSMYLTHLLWKDIEKNEQLSRFMFVLIVGGAISVLFNNNATARMSNYFSVYQIVLFMVYISNNLKYEKSVSGLLIKKDVFINATLILGVFPLLNFIYILRYCSII